MKLQITVPKNEFNELSNSFQEDFDNENYWSFVELQECMVYKYETKESEWSLLKSLARTDLREYKTTITRKKDDANSKESLPSPCIDRLTENLALINVLTESSPIHNRELWLLRNKIIETLSFYGIKHPLEKSKTEVSEQLERKRMRHVRSLKRCVNEISEILNLNIYLK